jgi:uncharacterized membrane protein YcaP (DUF421 family)
MKPEEIKLTDWVRILIGEVPAGFYIELVIRAMFFYLLLMVSMRLLGKRISSQLGRTDLAAMVTLAACIGVPLQAPDRGLLPAIVIAIVVVTIGRWVAAKAFKDQKFEKLSQGNIDILVKDSVLDLKRMKEVRITRERLVAQLRHLNIDQLGKVKRLYIEANGSFTLIKEQEPKPGLSLMPHWDDDYNQRFKKRDDLCVCEICGLTKEQPVKPDNNCDNCGSKKWTAAVESNQ